MSDELVTIAEFETAFEAQIAKNTLEDNNINATVVGNDLMAISPSVGQTWVEVKVFTKDAEQAKNILETHKSQSEGDVEGTDTGGDAIGEDA
jgi:hypothetical protein